MGTDSKAVLVTGGAGYIGSHTAKMLHQRGYTPVVFDNLSKGHRWAAKWGAFVEGDLADKEAIKQTLLEHRIQAVMHFAAFTDVGESVRFPALYYRNNVVNTLNLLEAMVEVGSEFFVFSSSAAVYGDAKEVPLTEEHAKNPVNPYGETKLAVERMLADFERAHGVTHVNLRYFNAAGADPEGELGELHDPETHLIPIVMEAAEGKRPHVAIFGTDYPTEDGTCLRDYIHVQDLASAHILALEHLINGGASDSFNLGIGAGYSVRQVIEEVARVSSGSFGVVEARRRPGDPPALVASNDKIRTRLGWEPELPDLSDIVRTAWEWRKAKL